MISLTKKPRHQLRKCQTFNPTMMALIFETPNFLVEAVDRPHIDRLDGGHIKITPKTRYRDRLELPPRWPLNLCASVWWLARP